MVSSLPRVERLKLKELYDDHQLAEEGSSSNVMVNNLLRAVGAK